jgi:uncharacterized protein YcbK (DUF882 family)/LysM repeat protein
MHAPLALALLLPAPSSVRADREHVVRSGQSLARIARKYDLSVGQLAAANGLAPAAALREGQVLTVPAKGIVVVAPGDTLAGIARARGVPATALARTNGLRDGSALRVGQRLVMPGDDASTDDSETPKWGAPRRPGVATFVRPWSRERKDVRLRTSAGRVPPAATRELRHLLRPRDSPRRKDPPPRLVRLLADVSDHFGGRAIHVVSGYRVAGGTTKPTSRHVRGHAIDFRIPGIPLRTLRDYCARFDRVGVGFYPTSGFVHLDVRERDARWTDTSGPDASDAAPDADGTEAPNAHEDEAEPD